jgi:transposase InsO family protein
MQYHESTDVQSTVANVINKAGLKKGQRHVLLSDNGSCYVSSELKDYLASEHILPIHGRVMNPQTQIKIERYHLTIKNVVKVNNYYLPEQLVDAIGEFVTYYNHERYHESLKNVTPADMYYGRQKQILKQRETIKKESLKRLFLKEKILFLNNQRSTYV